MTAEADKDLLEQFEHKVAIVARYSHLQGFTELSNSFDVVVEFYDAEQREPFNAEEQGKTQDLGLETKPESLIEAFVGVAIDIKLGVAKKESEDQTLPTIALNSKPELLSISISIDEATGMVSLLSDILTVEDIGLYRLTLTLRYSSETEDRVNSYEVILSVIDSNEADKDEKTSTDVSQTQKNAKDETKKKKNAGSE